MFESAVECSAHEHFLINWLQCSANNMLFFLLYSNAFLLFLQKKPDWSKGKPGDQKVKEEEVEAWSVNPPTKNFMWPMSYSSRPYCHNCLKINVIHPPYCKASPIYGDIPPSQFSRWQ